MDLQDPKPGAPQRTNAANGNYWLHQFHSRKDQRICCSDVVLLVLQGCTESWDVPFVKSLCETSRSGSGHSLDSPTELICDVRPPCTFVDAFTWLVVWNSFYFSTTSGMIPNDSFLQMDTIWNHQAVTIRLRSLLEIFALGSETRAFARRSASAPGCQMAMVSGIAFRRGEEI